MQNKYRSDIIEAVKMNKELNSLVNKKNNQISELNLLYKKKEIATNEKIGNLVKQSANIHIDYSKCMEIYDKEVKNLVNKNNEISNESKSKIEELEKLRLKNEYKAMMLEEENKCISIDYKEQLKYLKNNSNNNINKRANDNYVYSYNRK